MGRRGGRKRVTPARFTFGVLAIAAWSAGTVLLARTGDIGGAIGGALFTVPLCSLGEWLVHGVLYHGHMPGLGFIRTIHHQGHHFAIFPPDKYVQTTSKYEFMRFRKPLLPFRMSDNALDNFLTKWSQIALHFVVGIPLIMVPAWLLTHSIAFAVSALVTLSLISWLLGYVHGVIHTPGDRWVERQSWFQWLDRHHYIHHVDLSANINFGLPICDFLFGTQKWALTEKEAANFPSFEQAKPMAKDIPHPVAAPAE